MEDSFTKPVEEVVNYFKTDEITGLTDEQIQRYQEKYGPNGRHHKYLSSDSISLLPSKDECYRKRPTSI